MKKTADVIIIGGGPAGSTAATTLAKKGRSVLVFEKDKFPRFHIGESLLPHSMLALEKLGLKEKIEKAGFQEKFGGEIQSSCGTRGVQFYFKNGFEAKHGKAIQVLRSDFDKLLLDHSRECGAEVHEETSVTEILYHSDGVTVHTKTKDGTENEYRARYLIDCSGRNTLVGQKHNLKQAYTDLQKFAVYAHFTGVLRPEGEEGTLTRMVRGEDRWFWMIPLANGIMSIGVVMDTAIYRAQKQKPEDLLETAMAREPMIMSRMENSKRVSQVYASGDYSYRNTRLYGDQWLLAGDAAGFIDPIFSSGVFLAILSGEHSANAIDAALTDPHAQKKQFHLYDRRLNKVMDLYLRFVRSWYTKEFVEIFLHPTDMLSLAPAVNAVLAGNTGGSFALKWRLWLFQFLVRLQRFLPICPRLTLIPGSATPANAETP